MNGASRQLGDRSVRGLHHLHASASTARVLNLSALATSMEKLVEKGDYVEKPMFHSATLNRALVVKHRLRAAELDAFEGQRTVATKIILPFSGRDLKLGGQSIFIGGPGWQNFLASVCPSPQVLRRDEEVCELIDKSPSLDPFLLREYLAQHGYVVSDRYFVFSAADALRMEKFITSQVKQLISIATYQSGGDGSKHTARMVEALLSNTIDERLEPLRVSLKLDGQTFREGVFSWRGFLYYKWQLSELEPELGGAVMDISQLQLVGSVSPDERDGFNRLREIVLKGVGVELAAVREALATYDAAYADLTRNGNPAAFRKFLMDAPALFVTLGEKMGAVSHITSFWRYRFPRNSLLRIPGPEALDLMADFRASLCVRL